MFNRNSMKKEFARFKKVIDTRVTNYSSNLANGADNKEITELGNFLGITLPSDFVDLYLLSNGDRDKFIAGPIYGFSFLNIESIVNVMKQQKSLLDSFDDELKSSLDSACKSLSKGAIRANYINLKWIPFAHDSAGNYIGIDCDPDVGGSYGQVINFGRDENDKYVIAKNVKIFFENLSNALESRCCTIEEFDGEDVFVFNGSYHALDYLKHHLEFS